MQKYEEFLIELLDLYTNGKINTEEFAIQYHAYDFSNIDMLTTDQLLILQLYENICMNVINERASVHEIKQQFHSVQEISLVYQMYQAQIKNAIPAFWNKAKKAGPISKKTLYLDQNLFSPLLSNEKYNPGNFAANMQLIYSPSHIEEICKSKSEYHQHDIERISAVTNDYCYLFLDGMPTLMREPPRYPYKRIMHTLESTELAEKLKVLKSGDNELYYAKYDNENFRNKINNHDSENFLTNYSAEINEILKSKGLSYSIEQIKDGEYITYEDINSKIHELYEAMDCIGFKRDNLSIKQDGTRNERKVRSSRHDIEHLLYAANADVFITADARLYYRAVNIFKVLKKKVEVKRVRSFDELVQIYYHPH